MYNLSVFVIRITMLHFLCNVLPGILQVKSCVSSSILYFGSKHGLQGFAAKKDLNLTKPSLGRKAVNCQKATASHPLKLLNL